MISLVVFSCIRTYCWISNCFCYWWSDNKSTPISWCWHSIGKIQYSFTYHLHFRSIHELTPQVGNEVELSVLKVLFLNILDEPSTLATFQWIGHPEVQGVHTQCHIVPNFKWETHRLSLQRPTFYDRPVVIQQVHSVVLPYVTTKLIPDRRYLCDTTASLKQTPNAIDS